MKPKIN